jgi:hypothetical protein
MKSGLDEWLPEEVINGFRNWQAGIQCLKNVTFRLDVTGGVG